MTDKKDFKTLSQSDYQEWVQATKDVKKLKFNKHKVVDLPKPIFPIKNTNDFKFVPVPSFKLAEINLGEKGNLNKKVVRKMDQGKMPIDAKIDLHGLTEKEAYDRFCSFTETSYAKGHRLVLVITGKGTTSRPSILKSRLPVWINSERLLPYILRFTIASVKHGGSGAFYIYLRKSAI